MNEFGCSVHYAFEGLLGVVSRVVSGRLLASVEGSTQLLNWLIAQSWQICALAAVVWIASRNFGKTRPHLTHALWLMVIIKCVTPPVWSHQFAVFSHLQSVFIDAVPSTVIESPVHGDSANVHHLDSASLVSLTPVMNEANVSMASLSQGQPQDFVDLVTPRLDASESVEAVAAAAQVDHHPGLALLFPFALAGVMLGLLILITRFALCLHRIRRHRITEYDDDLRREIEALCRRLGVRRAPDILVSDVDFGPAVLGIFRRVLVLPKCLIDRGTSTLQRCGESLKPILAHELLHIRRGDLLTGTLQAIVQCLWWFHPVVWFANRTLTRETERCCDEEVVAELICSPAEYARCLLLVIESKQPLKAVPVFPGMKPVEITIQRMERIMSLKNGSRKRTPLRYWLIVATAALMVLPGAAWSRPDDKPPVKKVKDWASSAATASDAESQTLEEFERSIRMALQRSRIRATERAERRIRHTLQQNVSLHIQDLPFLDVVRRIATDYGMNIAVDVRVLETPRAPLKAHRITIDVEDVKLRTVLQMVLDQVGGLKYEIEREVVKISAKDVTDEPEVVEEPHATFDPALRKEVRIIGRVKNPGLYPLNVDQPTTVLDVINSAGAPVAGASDRVLLKRPLPQKFDGPKVNRVSSDAGVLGQILPGDSVNAGEFALIQISLKAMLSARSRKDINVIVEPGDVISIGPASDKEIARDVAKSLVAMGLSGDDIDINVKDGTTMLSGSVESSEMASAAGKVAAEVPGVGNVDNEMQVNSRLKDPSFVPAMSLRAFGPPQNAWPNIVQPGGRVIVKSGDSQRLDDALRAEDVSSARQDSTLRSREIEDQIVMTFSETELKNCDIKVGYARGRVLLHGSVSSEAQKEMAEDLVASLKNVQSVENRLVVPVVKDGAASPLISMVAPRIIIEEEEEELILGLPSDKTPPSPSDEEVRLKARMDRLTEILNRELRLSVKDQTLDVVLKSVEQCTGITIAFDPGLATRIVSCETAGLDVRKALDVLLAPQGLRARTRFPRDLRSVQIEVSPKSDMATRAYNVADLVMPWAPTREDRASETQTSSGNIQQVSAVGRSDSATVADFSPLLELIRISVEPDSWDTENGHAKIQANKNTLSLVIRQTAESHDKIVELLQALRKEHDQMIVSQCLILHLPVDTKINLNELGITWNTSATASKWTLMPGSRTDKFVRRLCDHGAEVLLPPQVSALADQPIRMTVTKTEQQNIPEDLDISLTARPLANGDLLRIQYALTTGSTESPILGGHALLKSGQTLVTEGSTTRPVGVPILEKVPLTTRRFRNSGPHGRFLLLITPRIVRHEDEAPLVPPVR